MTTTEIADVSERSTPPSDTGSAAEQSMTRLLRPYVGGFAAVVIL